MKKEMTRIFTYTFTRANGEVITLKKKVTDNMEERNFHKTSYAVNYFNDILRSKYGYHKSVVTASSIVEVK